MIAGVKLCILTFHDIWHVFAMQCFLLEENMSCQIKKPKRGKAAAAQCPEVQPIASLKTGFVCVCAQQAPIYTTYIHNWVGWRFPWKEYIYISSGQISPASVLRDMVCPLAGAGSQSPQLLTPGHTTLEVVVQLQLLVQTMACTHTRSWPGLFRSL